MAMCRQKGITMMTQLGCGLAGIMLGLYATCLEMNSGELCELFTDESFEILRYPTLISSQVIFIFAFFFLLIFESSLVFAFKFDSMFKLLWSFLLNFAIFMRFHRK